MRLKKVEKDEIVCIVSNTDLKKRGIDLSTLNYNSSLAKALFDEIIFLAKDEGFEMETQMTLSIEAVPFENGSLQVTVQKADVPYELDPRFSDFSYKEIPNETIPASAKSLLNAFLSFAANSDGIAAIHVERVPNPFGNAQQLPKPKDEVIKTKMVFKFNDFDALCDATKKLKYNNLRSSLYKDEEKKLYLLLIELDKFEGDYANDLKADIDILKSVGVSLELNKITNAYLEEHCKKLMEDDAIAKLSKA